ncbi:hypothetical protein [Paludisphaera sp.]|uniref:hypothetical protein n=1 Tax=Paludisphaera sp. TaxID=2017432 RepID=UPI00301DE068
MSEPEMIPPPREADDPAGVAPPRPGEMAANFDGFIALLLIALFLGFSRSLGAPRRVTGDFLFESIAMLLVYSGAWLFAIGGMRRGAGANRGAAIASLMLLSASVAYIVAVIFRSSRPL